MAPPNGVSPAGQREVPLPNPADERQELLSSEKLVTDERWEDPSFRTQQHLELYLALKALDKFMAGEIPLEKMHSKMEAWTESASYSDPANQEFKQAVVDKLHAQLRLFQTEANSARAAQVAILLPAATPARAKEPAETKGTEKQTAPAPPPSDEVTDSYTPPKGWRFGAATFDWHVADEALRGVPRYYTLFVLPKDGLTHNQSSKFGWNAGAQFSYNDFNFFAGAYQEDMTPVRSPAHYNRAGVRLGVLEYSSPAVGERGPGKGFHLSAPFFGGNRSRVGLEMGAAWCEDPIDGSNVSGVKCPEGSFQMGVINQTDFFSMGYGPFEVGVNLLPGKIYLQKERLALPEINRLPMEFHASWHFSEPAYAFKPQNSDEVLRNKVSDAEVTMTAMTLGANWMANNYRHRQEAAFQQTRLLSFGNPDQFALLNTGTFMNGALVGIAEGTLGYRLSRDLRHGTKGQRAGLGSLMGVELAANLIGMLATPGIPDDVEVFPGQQVPEGTDLSGNEGITNLQARAFRLNLPQIAVRDGLAVLGAVGAFGDRNKAIKGESALYPIMHGVLAAGGAALILTSGNGSGTGFLGHSILGNQPPKGDVIEIKGSEYDFPAQAGQTFRLEAGAQALAYGGSGLFDWLMGRYTYLKFKECEDRQKDDPDVVCNDRQKAEAKSKKSALISNPRLGLQVGRNGGHFTFGGEF